MTLIGLVACCTTEKTEIVVETPLVLLWGQFSICTQFALQMGLFGLAGVTRVSLRGPFMTLVGLVARCTTEKTEVVVETPLAFLWGQFSICAQFALQMGFFGLTGVTGVTGVSSGFGPRGPRVRTRVCLVLI